MSDLVSNKAGNSTATTRYYEALILLLVVTKHTQPRPVPTPKTAFRARGKL
jgi:hypothetical protein